jgi:hypothetical protein
MTTEQQLKEQERANAAWTMQKQMRRFVEAGATADQVRQTIEVLVAEAVSVKELYDRR